MVMNAKNNIDYSKNSTALLTPCVRICRYNSDFFDGAVCIGCFRETFDIGNWASFDTKERIYALQDALDRQECVDPERFPGSISLGRMQEIHDYYKTLL
jgi:predicted Fe-S protein YdhL (DUF1289 family)